MLLLIFVVVDVALLTCYYDTKTVNIIKELGWYGPQSNIV